MGGFYILILILQMVRQIRRNFFFAVYKTAT